MIHLTSNNWKTLYPPQDEGKYLDDPQLLARVEYIQYTPLWAGDAYGYTFNLIDGELTPVQPSPQQLVGRARYLMRIAQIGKNAKDHREADKIVSKVFGSTSRASILQVKTHYHSQNQQQAKPYYIDQTQAEGILQHREQREKGIYMEWAELGYSMLRELLSISDTSQKYENKNKNSRTNLKDKLDPNDPEDKLLMTIPRIYMVLSSIKDPLELALKQPIRPGYYKLTLEVRLRGGVKDNPRLTALGLASLILTPQLLGLGKAVNRGLGRFKLASYALGPAANKLGEYSGTVERIIKTMKQLSRCKECLKDALGSYLSLLPSHNGKVPRGEDLMAPSLPRATIRYTDSPIHPCPYAPTELHQIAKKGYCKEDQRYDCSQIQDEKIRVYCILSAIGAATLKSTWKLRKEGNVKTPGPGYHTWVLGLPRGIKHKKKNTRYYTYTGYYIVRKGRRWTLPKESESDPHPGLIEKFLRHQSVFILFPSANGGLYLVATPSYGSLSSILEDPGKRSKALYHAGLHRGKPHWAKVTYIATTKTGKFKDKFGIISPSNQEQEQHQYDDKRVYTVITAYNAALKWLHTLLHLNDEYTIS